VNGDRAQRPDQRARDHVTGVVDADQHPARGQRDGREQHRGRTRAEAQQQRHGDRERRRGVVAREARIRRVGEEGVDLGMGHERPRAADEVREDAGDQQRGAARRDRLHSRREQPAPPRQEAGGDQQQDAGEEHRLGDHRPRARGVLPAVMGRGEVVRVLGQHEIRVRQSHRASLRRAT
jgi:hypothetical protein